MSTFTPELTFGPWASGILVDGPARYRTIQPASTSIFPLDFTGSSLPDGATFSRASSVTYTNADGTHTVFGYNAPALGTKGILIEPAGTNAIAALSGAGTVYCSENFESWDKTAGTVALNSGTFLDGGNSLNLWTSSASGAFASFLSRSSVHAIVGDFTCHLFIKKGNRRYVAVDLYGGTKDYAAVFDMDTVSYVGTPYDATTSRSITAMANGIFHIVMSVASPVAGTTSIIISTATGNNFVATSGDTLYLCGIQFESGLEATSYIPQKNYIFQSETINAAPHVTELLSFDLNAITAPDGQLTGDKMSELAGLGNHEVYGVGVPLLAGKSYTVTGWAQGDERRYVYMAWSFGDGNTAAIVIDTQTGTITQTDDYGTTTLIASSIAAAPNGWYFVLMTFSDSVASGSGYRFATTNTATPNLSTFASSHYDTDQVGAGAYWWGLQCVRGTAFTPYYYTGASNSARAAANLSFDVPTDCTLRYTFDDDTTQDVAVVAGTYSVPTTGLSRRYIKTIDVV